MITANERALDGLELFEVNGQESFEMENETLKICASEDGTIHRSVRGLDVLDADGLSLAYAVRYTMKISRYKSRRNFNDCLGFYNWWIIFTNRMEIEYVKSKNNTQGLR